MYSDCDRDRDPVDRDRDPVERSVARSDGHGSDSLSDSETFAGSGNIIMTQ